MKKAVACVAAFFIGGEVSYVDGISSYNNGSGDNSHI